MSSNSEGRRREKEVHHQIHYRDLTLYSNSWAAVVGINRYRDQSIDPLQFAEPDAEEMAQLLPSLGFPRGNIRLLLASRDEITPLEILRLLQGPMARTYREAATRCVGFA